MDEFVNNHYSKSFSCESLFIERPSLKRKHNMTQVSNGLSINNEDICYIVNCGELIKIVKEVGLENDKIITAAVKDFDDNKLNTRNDYNNSSILNDCLNVLNNEDSIVEFSKWLNMVEKQLNSYCCCSFVSNSTNDEWKDIISEHKSIQSELESCGRKFINAIKLNGSCISKSLLGSEERRWKLLWLKSLEYSMIIEQCKLCPKHSYRDILSDQVPTTPPKRHKLNSKNFADSNTETFSFMKNRRVQTTMIGSCPNEKLDHLRGAKFDIIHKDIGYSSDADMSDACENHQCPDYVVSSKFARKRHIRRRRSGGPRNRPWSIHSEWPDWDYYQPPPCIATDCKSSDDWNSYDDENVVRSLIEFGENYEFWIKNEDDAIIRASTPKRELEANDYEIEADKERVVGSFSMDYKDEENKVSSYAIKSNEQIQSSIISSTSNKTTCNADEIGNSKKKVKKSSTSYIVYFTLSVFIVLFSSIFAFLPPHYQRTFPRRPPPI